MHAIDSSIDGKVKLRFDFGMSEARGKLIKLKEYRHKNTTTINANNDM